MLTSWHKTFEVFKHDLILNETDPKSMYKKVMLYFRGTRKRMDGNCSDFVTMIMRLGQTGSDSRRKNKK